MTTKEERIVVSLSGGGPWGFRLQGGAGTGLPLIVSKVRRKSKAHRRLREGDRILSVNGRTCEGLTYDQLMDIADKCGTDLTLEILRKEHNKENKPPQQQQHPAVKTIREMDNSSSTKELLSFSETSSKVTAEKELLKIKSATVMQEPKPFENFTSSKLEERPPPQKAEAQVVESFPSFNDLQPRADMSTSSKQESVTGDDKNFTKTVVETKHEVKGGTETSFIKKEQESFSKSSTDPHGLPDITMDTIDLNNLISQTQKRLDSFRNNFKSDGILDSSIGDMKKTEMIQSSTTSDTKTFETSNKMSEKTTVKVSSESTGLEKSQESVVSKQDPMFKLPDLGFSSQPSESFKLPDIGFNSQSSESFKLPDIGFNSQSSESFKLPDIGFNSQSSESSTITTDIPFGTTTVTKKKMFASSSFYEEPDSIYPTMQEQVELARKIASSLADDTNKKSKGSNMFYKRVKRSSKWIHEGPEPSDESGPGTPEIQGVEPPTPDPSQVPFRPIGPSRLKLVLDPRHALDLAALRSSGYVISEHNVVSPEVCHGLVKDLHSPVGKGAALFAKRKKKSEEWVVDEEKVKALLREQENRTLTAPPLSTSPMMNQYSSLGRQEMKLVKSPWEAAMESPYGLCDSAFARVHPDQLADTVIRAADNKISLSRESSRMEGCISPPVAPPLTPAAAMHDIYHAKAPKGWPGSTTTADILSSAAPAPLPPVYNPIPQQQAATMQNGFQPSRKMVFQNFNTVPRLWRGASNN